MNRNSWPAIIVGIMLFVGSLSAADSPRATELEFNWIRPDGVGPPVPEVMGEYLRAVGLSEDQALVLVRSFGSLLACIDDAEASALRRFPSTVSGEDLDDANAAWFRQHTAIRSLVRRSTRQCMEQWLDEHERMLSREQAGVWHAWRGMVLYDGSSPLTTGVTWRTGPRLFMLEPIASRALLSPDARAEAGRILSASLTSRMHLFDQLENHHQNVALLIDSKSDEAVRIERIVLMLDRFIWDDFARIHTSVQCPDERRRFMGDVLGQASGNLEMRNVAGWIRAAAEVLEDEEGRCPEVRAELADATERLLEASTQFVEHLSQVKRRHRDDLPPDYGTAYLDLVFQVGERCGMIRKLIARCAIDADAARKPGQPRMRELREAPRAGMLRRAMPALIEEDVDAAQRQDTSVLTASKSVSDPETTALLEEAAEVADRLLARTSIDPDLGPGWGDVNLLRFVIRVPQWITAESLHVVLRCDRERLAATHPAARRPPLDDAIRELDQMLQPVDGRRLTDILDEAIIPHILTDERRAFARLAELGSDSDLAAETAADLREAFDDLRAAARRADHWPPILPPQPHFHEPADFVMFARALRRIEALEYGVRVWIAAQM